MAYLILQYAVLGIAVAFSLWHLLNRLSPKTVQGLKARFSKRAPQETPQGCGSGCDSCRMCATISALSKDVSKT